MISRGKRKSFVSFSFPSENRQFLLNFHAKTMAKFLALFAVPVANIGHHANLFSEKSSNETQKCKCKMYFFSSG